MENENKNKKGFRGSVIIIVILLLSVFSLVGYICYDKFMAEYDNSSTNLSFVVSDEKNSNTDKEVKDEILDSKSRLVQSLYKMVYDDRGGQLKSWIYPSERDKILASELPMESISKFKNF